MCVYARIPREELEGRCVHYVTRRYYLAHIYIAMILVRVTRAGVTAAEPPSPGLSLASSPTSSASRLDETRPDLSHVSNLNELLYVESLPFFLKSTSTMELYLDYLPGSEKCFE